MPVRNMHSCPYTLAPLTFLPGTPAPDLPALTRRHPCPCPACPPMHQIINGLMMKMDMPEGAQGPITINYNDYEDGSKVCVGGGGGAQGGAVLWTGWAARCRAARCREAGVAWEAGPCWSAWGRCRRGAAW